MALTREEREARIKINELLDRYSEDLKNIFDDYTPISEATNQEEKITSLSDLQKLMEDNQNRLAFLGKNEFKGESKGSIAVSILLYSTKKVKVPENDNLITLGYEVDRDYYTSELERLEVRTNAKSTSLESFMELPIKPDVKDELSARDLVRRCDSTQFYKLYQDEALGIIRKMFPLPYGMFTGPNLYKREEKVIFVNGQPQSNTLYVSYDRIKKKFRYGYNPDFILESVIEEWMLNRNAYKSLKDCYCYLLAFTITHEMLHIVHHNTTTDSVTGADDSRLSTADHEVANCVQDSFINCKIARRFSGIPQLNSYSSRLAPMIQNGIGSKVSVRIEHNKGFKKFETSKELSEKISQIVIKNLGASSDLPIYYYDERELQDRKLSDYEGADVFITVNISPTLNEIRSHGSNLFQTCFNDIIKCITDGKAHEIHTAISDEEKASDLDVLPVGTIVMVRNKSRDIGIIESYNDADDTYNVNRMDSKGVRKVKDSKGDLCIPEYEDSGVRLGTFSRMNIRPYNPEDDSYYENVQKDKKDKLSPEDLMGLMGGGMPPEAQPNQPEEGPTKCLNVGDIVWVRKARKFGRIVSINNGKFNVEEVVEKPCKVIDDSDNYI